VCVGVEIVLMGKSKDEGSRFLEIVVIVVILGILIALLIPAVLAARRAARRTQRANCMKQIGLALHNFHDAYKFFPPAVRTDEEGRPLSSWRFYLAPFVEAVMLDIDYGKAWDDPVNRELVARRFYCLCFTEDADSPAYLHTNIVAITGPGTAFDGEKPCRREEIDSDTILAIEIADSGVHWAEPGDLDVDRIPESITAGMDGRGVHVLFADGAVWFLDRDVPLEDLKKFFTIESAKQYDREQVLGPY
jgi:hypothetical protein